jgi:hypothetical protein
LRNICRRSFRESVAKWIDPSVTFAPSPREPVAEQLSTKFRRIAKGSFRLCGGFSHLPGSIHRSFRTFWRSLHSSERSSFLTSVMESSWWFQSKRNSPLLWRPHKHLDDDFGHEREHHWWVFTPMELKSRMWKRMIGEIRKMNDSLNNSLPHWRIPHSLQAERFALRGKTETLGYCDKRDWETLLRSWTDFFWRSVKTMSSPPLPPLILLLLPEIGQLECYFDCHR